MPFCLLPCILQRSWRQLWNVWCSPPDSFKKVHPPQLQSQHWCAEAGPQLAKRIQWFILSWKMTQRGNCMLWNDRLHCNLLGPCPPAIPHAAFPLEIWQMCHAHFSYKPLQRQQGSHFSAIRYTADNSQSLVARIIKFSVTGDTQGKLKWVRRVWGTSTECA